MRLSGRLHHLVTRERDSGALGVVRAIVGAAALVKVFDFSGILLRLTDPGRVRVPLFEWAPTPTNAAIWLLIAVWTACSTAFALGWRTRWTGGVLTTLFAFVLLLDAQLYSNHLYLLLLLCGLLTLADSGAAFSLDARAGRGRRRVPAWPIDLIKVQIAVVYLFAGVAKINLTYISGGMFNSAWRWDGTLALPEFLRTAELLLPLAVVSIFMECFLAVGLWFSRWRADAFVLGLALHLGIVLTMSPVVELSVFAALSLSLYLLFLDAERGSRVVVWDDRCSFCRTWVRWVSRLDWLCVHRFVGSSDELELRELRVTRREADEALQLIDGERRAAGFTAVVRILEVLPVSFLWAPLLRIGLVRKFGDRAYAAVAQRRTCAVPPAVAARPPLG